MSSNAAQNSYFPTPVRKFIDDTSSESFRSDIEWQEDDILVE